MGKTREEKIAEFVKEGSVSKLRNFMKKHKRVDLNSVRLVVHSYQPLLHMACMTGNDSIARVLLQGGADPCLADTRGDTALHVALRRAIFGHEHVFENLVCLLLKYCSDNVLDVANKSGQTPRHLLKKFVTEISGKYGPKGAFAAGLNPDNKTEEGWNEKMQQAWVDDDLPDQRYYHGFRESPSQKQESFDDWADRLAKEYRQKRQETEWNNMSSRQRSNKRKGQEDARQDNADTKHKSKKMPKKMIGKERKDHLLLMKLRYEKNLKVFQAQEMDSISYDDIPWPCNTDNAEHMVQVLLGGIDRNNEEEFKKYLRSQQKDWHPDKFMQKYEQKLKDGDRERIMEKVKELSQALNKAGEEKKDSEYSWD